jgi:hypothetical protein
MLPPFHPLKREESRSDSYGICSFHSTSQYSILRFGAHRQTYLLLYAQTFFADCVTLSSPRKRTRRFGEFAVHFDNTGFRLIDSSQIELIK